ncbi:DEA(D/H)-box RNA helicase family protein [Euphorbia peplus]|nr:DEA(D/H)-box RNA helicase family protein [Euphorbia peplus]
MSLSISIPTHISFSKTLTSQTPILPFNFSHLSLTTRRNPTTIIRMGGGPRTYPGGVSKWQWKRMQAKKAKQLLKARLARERQIYEMRKRVELKAAVSELERPWEVVRRAPTLFSVKADEQLKVLADRFQKPGGFDMWSERDGPQLFESPDGFPSARFFRKRVVHSVKPYGFVSDREIEDLNLGSDDIGSDFGHGDLGFGEIGDENLGWRNGVPGNGKSRRLDSDFDKLRNFPMSLSISIPTHISFSKTLTSQTPILPFNFSHLSLTTRRNPTTIIRMGGGPRTYPGGVSKWQWKRMQAKKAKQLLKARLARKRQIYEMRKRVELKISQVELF